jgi:hemin uptake protein HemP
MMTMKVKINVANGHFARHASSGTSQPKMMVEKPETLEQALPKRKTADDIQVLESAELFRGSNEIAIRHDGAVYRLKITRQRKLILNK